MNQDNNVTLQVNGRQWGGWTSLSISAGVERIARDFNVEITRRWPGGDEVKQMQPRIKNGDSVAVLIGNDLVMTGYVDATPVRYDAHSLSVGIVGRSRTEDLIDCSATLTQFASRNLVQIVHQLAAPFSINVVNEGYDGGPISDFQVDFGETVMEVIDKLIGMQQVLVYDNAKGELVIGGVGTKRTVTALVLGENILSCDTEKSIKDRFSQYIVSGQRAGNDHDFGEATNTAISARTLDGGITRYRPMVIKQTGNANGETCGERSEFEMQRRAARTDEVTYTVQGWRQGNGALWEPNMRVLVYDPVLGFNNAEMLIAEVTYRKDSQGTVAELRVGPADAYLPKPKKLKKRKAKAVEDEF